MASIQATAHAATWQQHMCVCVMPRTVWLYECSSPPPPPLISHIHPLGSSFFFCSHSHSSRLLALRVCPVACAVWGCQLHLPQGLILLWFEREDFVTEVARMELNQTENQHNSEPLLIDF